MNTDMSTDPDQIRAQVAALLADLPDPAVDGVELDDAEIDVIAARLEEARPWAPHRPRLHAECIPGAAPPDPIAVRLPGGRTAGRS